MRTIRTRIADVVPCRKRASRGHRFIEIGAAVYVCICNAITDHEVRGAVALGARSLADLKSTLGVATQCGRCADCAHGLVREACAELAECGAGDD